MLKIAMLSGWHVHAKGYADELNALKDVKVTAIWDEDQTRGKSWAAEIGAIFEPDLDKLLANKEIDAVAVTTPTNLHKEVMIKAAEAGKHIFTEKVLALTVADCEEIAKAIEKAGVKFCISFPHRTRPEILYAKKVIEDGLLGEITTLRIRNAHDGSSADWLPAHFYNEEETGGGAMMDLGAHGMYLARWLLGRPRKINSMFNNVTDKRVEDNAISIIEFANKAMAINETGFVSANSPFSLEVYGTEGTLVFGGPDGKLRVNSNKSKTDIKGWVTPTQFPEPLPAPIKQWVDGILNDGKIHFGLNEGIQLTELMEKAYQSYQKKSEVLF